MDGVADWIARTFIVAFVLGYLVLVVGWLIWNFRNWFAARFRKSVRPELRPKIPHLGFSHHNRHTH